MDDSVLIEEFWNNRELKTSKLHRKAVENCIAALDSGKIRVAIKNADTWEVNEMAKKAVLLYFLIAEMKVSDIPPFEFYDKIPLKKNYQSLGIRVVPHAVARYGSYLARGVVMMPSYVNIGAYVDEGTLIDTWVTVGSCAQIGKNVHLSGGVGIGGVLEPIQATPVIIGNDCFIGSRSIVVEGVYVDDEAVLGANVVLTNSTKIIDVSCDKPIEMKGYIPKRSVVISGSYTKKFPAGEFQVSCALIIGKRKESTDKKTSLNSVLRDFDIAV